jgi:hypothetical protein
MVIARRELHRWADAEQLRFPAEERAAETYADAG